MSSSLKDTPRPPPTKWNICSDRLEGTDSPSTSWINTYTEAQVEFFFFLSMGVILLVLISCYSLLNYAGKHLEAFFSLLQ